MNTIIPIILTLLCNISTLCAQDSNNGPLAVGDKMPELTINHVLNKSVPENLSIEEHGGLIILDFFSTWCSTCIRSIGSLEQLQGQFNKLKIILITDQDEKEVKPIIIKRGWTLPTVANDTLLHSMFPHLSVPHQVWIKKGRVIAITSHQYANKENIRKVISGERVEFYLKEEQHVNLQKPWVSSFRRPLYQSSITPPVNNGASGKQRTDSSFLVYNTTLQGLYNEAFQMPHFPVGAYIKLEVCDSLRQLIQGPSKGISGEYAEDMAFIEWQKKYTYCYNLQFTEGTKVPFYRWHKMMQQDLNNFFSMHMGIEGALQKRKVKCLVLTLSGDGTLLTTHGNKSMVKADEKNYKLVNKPLSLLLKNIVYYHYDLGLPVVNATAFTGNVDLEINSGLHNLQQVNRELESYGLFLREKEMEIEMLVINEINKHPDLQSADAHTQNP